uniref:Uncharacterized protein n=1 Tax=Parascaris equorum TaxID=6256 RepID=A0A914RPF3_PAREQ
LRAENEQLKEKLATFEDAHQPTLFVRPEAPCVIELQRDPALITWQRLIKELAYSPSEMIVGFTLGVEEEAMVEAYGEGVYLNGDPLMPRRAQQLRNADRVPSKFIRLIGVLVTFLRGAWRADAEREKQQLMNEIDEELKERKQELDEGYQKLREDKGTQTFSRGGVYSESDETAKRFKASVLKII